MSTPATGSKLFCLLAEYDNPDALVAAIKRANPDLVIAATESTDGYTGTTPVQVAELLGHSDTTMVMKHYSMLSQRVGYLRDMAKKATGA